MHTAGIIHHEEEISLPNTTFNEELYREQFNSEYSEKVLPVSILFGLTAVLGFVCNVLVVYIYGVKYNRCNFKYFLFVMGVIGIVQCAIMLPTQAAEMHYWFVFPGSWLCRVSAYVFGYTVIACYFVLLLIAIDRFRKVCRPYGWQIQASTARNLCVLVTVAALVFALPPGIISGHHEFVTSYRGHNISVTVCATDDVFQNRDWAIYSLLLSGGFPVSVVILITCVLYGLILKQFYQGSNGLRLHSMYKHASTQLASGNTFENDNKSGSGHVCTEVNNLDRPTPERSPASTRHMPTKHETILEKTSSKSKSFSKVIRIFLWTRESYNKSSSKPGGVALRSSGSSISRSGVRSKIMRKTLIVLIITISCIVALILTFCLHIIAEWMNKNALSVSQAKLVAFVIFHRGSFSIICAVFPILYGIRDPKFRRALLKMVANTNAAQLPMTTTAAAEPSPQRDPSVNEDSKC